MANIRYWNDYFPGGNACFMMNMPDWGDETPAQACVHLIELLDRCGKVESAKGDSILIYHSTPHEVHSSTRFDGEVEDMALLRRILILHALGRDLNTLRLFLSGDWQFKFELTQKELVAT